MLPRHRKLLRWAGYGGGLAGEEEAAVVVDVGVVDVGTDDASIYRGVSWGGDG